MTVEVILDPFDNYKTKACVAYVDDNKYLVSYSTTILKVDRFGEIKVLSDYTSSTTSKHIKRFLEEYTIINIDKLLAKYKSIANWQRAMYKSKKYY